MEVIQENVALDERLLESAALCLDEASTKSLGSISLDEDGRERLELLATKANEGELTSEEAREYDRFIELSDILATLRLKAERRLGAAR